MSGSETATSERPLKPALMRGAVRRCPACGQGRLFRGYLALADRCDCCDEDLSHQRADDGPAYLTILLVSHLGAPLLLAVYMAYRPSPMSLMIGFGLGAVLLSLLLLPAIKGAFVGFQWARRMHGFGGEPKRGTAPVTRQAPSL